MHHLMCPWRPHRAQTTLVTRPLPSLQGCCWNFHQSSLECHFNSTCLGEPGDTPSSRVPRRIAESPGLAEATDVNQASSPRLSNLPFLTVIHSGCLLLSPQEPSTGRRECRDHAVCGFGLREFHTPTTAQLTCSPPFQLRAQKIHPCEASGTARHGGTHL